MVKLWKMSREVVFSCYKFSISYNEKFYYSYLFGSYNIYNENLIILYKIPKIKTNQITASKQKIRYYF